MIISIHAPAWGATRSLQTYHNPNRYFNPRPRVGGDSVTTSPMQYSLFQSTPPRGGRPHCSSCLSNSL